MKELRHLDLPEMPSDLLEMALSDLARVETSTGYVVDMAVWHSPKGGICFVCLAGAVLTRFLEPTDVCSGPDRMFDDETACKLMALDMLRGGAIGGALMCMGFPIPSGVRSRRVPEYERDPVRFHLTMMKIIDELREIGL